MMPDEEVNVTKPQPAGSSTGAIPKSISFDKTAERGDKVNGYLHKLTVHEIMFVLECSFTVA
jgi:hypothetical protein